MVIKNFKLFYPEHFDKSHSGFHSMHSSIKEVEKYLHGSINSRSFSLFILRLHHSSKKNMENGNRANMAMT
jgi:hypothetical protein